MKYLITLFCFSILIITFGCSSDSEDCTVGAIQNPNQLDPIDGTIYRQSAQDCRLPKVQTFQVSNITGGEVRAAQNTILFIRQGAFTQLDGTFIDGDITLSILEMYRPGEIIACQLSTNGLNDIQKVEPLLSESILYIKAEYNGNPILLKNELEIFVPSKNRNLELSVFNSPSCPEFECQVLWEINAQSFVFEEPYQGPNGISIAGYRTFVTDISQFGWLSFARYNLNPEPRGVLYNKALSPYSLANSNVFLKYDSESVAVGMFSEFDAANDVFSEKYNEIPKNTPANVIFVSKPENEFAFESIPIITENGKITITRNLQKGSEDNLIDYINNL
ncbi:hypothetical protein Aeqsu_1045 [Aequorivita sublithincola DSM 14238]|uniref:Lipoprotein n=1 Tax=Aequorivita sublithincola (strain DSM 14238 / LMG 21431 / ACAM 643 / 9-3) TaxID=746697 RepID=I3YU76_AEQSU|nr:hypothetical protein [Aequorivita sublithincola]AFL80544.1 hypothetical protein Aeqsu_1045 [Aequorivita sublithincola DSM 14238]